MIGKKRFIQIVVACDPRGVISYQQKIPWHLPEDKALLHRIIKDQYVFMGRATYESMPQDEADNTKMMVLSRNRTVAAHNRPAQFFSNYDDLLQAMLQLNATVYCLGGEEVYRLALQSPYLEACHVSHVHQPYPGDRYFPLELLKSNQFEVKSQAPEWSYVVYR
jgi:dihydrofolate reductase